MSTPALSIVTLTWNNERCLGRLLTSVARDVAGSGIAVEMILVDNGSTDATLDIAREFQERHDYLHIVPLGKNHGTTMTRNIGARMSRGDYVLFLDSDTELRPGTLAGLLAACDRVPDRSRLGVLHPRLCYPDGEFQESARRFPTVFTKLYRLFDLEDRRRRDESIDEVLAGRMVTVDYAILAAWLVPREVFDRVGLLDERIFYSPEDLEFCARCWKNGLEVWYCPEVEIIHDCQRLTKKRPLSLLGLSHMKGLARYWAEYGTFLRRPDVVPRRTAAPPRPRALSVERSA